MAQLTHIESIIDSAAVQKRGPNFFLVIVAGESKVYLNEWSEPNTKKDADRYIHSQVFSTHFGEFDASKIASLPGKMLYCDAKPKGSGEYFFTSKFKVEDLKDMQNAPSEMKPVEPATEVKVEPAIEKAPEVKVETPVAPVVETKVETPVETKVETQTDIIKELLAVEEEASDKEEPAKKTKASKKSTKGKHK